MTRTARRTRVVTVLLLAGAVTGLGACGGQEAADRPAANPTDRAFVAGMVPHHQSAIEMGRVAQQRAESPFVKRLADEIIAAQDREIRQMRQIDRSLAQAGVQRGDLGMPAHMMGMAMDPAALRTAKPFDRAFIDMMIPHHQGAIRMARVEIARGQSPDLKALAREIISAQAREITQMNDHRRQAFGAPSPAGGVPPESGGSSSSGGMRSGGHGGM